MDQSLTISQVGPSKLIFGPLYETNSSEAPNSLCQRSQ